MRKLSIGSMLLGNFHSSHGKYIEINGQFFDLSKLEEFQENQDSSSGENISSEVAYPLEKTLMRDGGHKFRGLISLKLTYCGLTSMPWDLLASTPGLKILDLCGNRIKDINNRLNSPNLRRISLCKNEIGPSIPANTFENLPNCLEIDLSNNSISGPLTLLVQPGLQELFLGHNQISSLRIRGISRTNVKLLDLQRNRLNAGLESGDDPKFLESLPDTLEFLQLNGNSLCSLPPNFTRNLVRLRQLYLAWNELVELPVSIARLQNLVLLDLCGNEELTHLPGELLFRASPGQRDEENSNHLVIRCDSRLMAFNSDQEEEEDAEETQSNASYLTTESAIKSFEQFVNRPEYSPVPTLRDIAMHSIIRSQQSYSEELLDQCSILTRHQLNEPVKCTFCQESVFDRTPFLSDRSFIGHCPLFYMGSESDGIHFGRPHSSASAIASSLVYRFKFTTCLACEGAIRSDLKRTTNSTATESIQEASSSPSALEISRLASSYGQIVLINLIQRMADAGTLPPSSPYSLGHLAEMFNWIFTLGQPHRRSLDEAPIYEGYRPL